MALGHLETPAYAFVYVSRRKAVSDVAPDPNSPYSIFFSAGLRPDLSGLTISNLLQSVTRISNSKQTFKEAARSHDAWLNVRDEIMRRGPGALAAVEKSARDPLQQPHLDMLGQILTRSEYIYTDMALKFANREALSGSDRMFALLIYAANIDVDGVRERMEKLLGARDRKWQAMAYDQVEYRPPDIPAELRKKWLNMLLPARVEGLTQTAAQWAAGVQRQMEGSGKTEEEIELEKKRVRERVLARKKAALTSPRRLEMVSKGREKLLRRKKRHLAFLYGQSDGESMLKDLRDSAEKP